MPVAVNQPRQREEKDPLDTILKGLHIAQGIYGIKEAGDKAQLLKAQRAEDSQYRQADLAAKEAGLAAQGFEKKTGEDGVVSYLRPPGYEDPKDAYTKAQIEHMNVQNRKLEAEIKKLGKPNAEDSFKVLPKDRQIEVEKLTGKIVDRKQIKNDIDAALVQLDDPNLDDNAKLQIGNELLKTLNSSQGADAIGVEEAKRLGAKLQFAMGNFFNDNPTQFGRDLPGFIEGVRRNSDRLGMSAGASQNRIDELMGRGPGMYAPLPDAIRNNPNQRRALENIINPKAQAAPKQVFKTNEIEWK